MADNYTFKDAAGNTVTHASEDIGSGVQASKHVLVDASGVDVAKAEDAAHSSGDSGIMALAVRKDTASALAGSDGDYIPLIVDGNGLLHVRAANLAGITAAGQAAKAGSLPVTLASDEDLLARLPASLGQKAMSAALAVSIASDQSVVGVGGAVAHDAADSGNPVKIGGKAFSATPTAVANADRVDAWYDLTGRMTVRQRPPLILTLTSGAPTPTGTDIVNSSNGAIASTDLDIRNTVYHPFVIPLAAGGYSECWIGVRATTSYDQTLQVYVYSAGNYNSLPAAVTAKIQLLAGSAMAWVFSAQNGGWNAIAGGEDVKSQAIYHVPALASAAPYVVLSIGGAAGNPTQGAFEIVISRRYL